MSRHGTHLTMIIYESVGGIHVVVKLDETIWINHCTSVCLSVYLSLEKICDQKNIKSALNVSIGCKTQIQLNYVDLTICNLVDMLGTFPNSLAYSECCNYPIEGDLRMRRITSDMVSILQMAKKQNNALDIHAYTWSISQGDITTVIRDMLRSCNVAAAMSRLKCRV